MYTTKVVFTRHEIYNVWKGQEESLKLISCWMGGKNGIQSCCAYWIVDNYKKRINQEKGTALGIVFSLKIVFFLVQTKKKKEEYKTDGASFWFCVKKKRK